MRGLTRAISRSATWPRTRSLRSYSFCVTCNQLCDVWLCECLSTHVCYKSLGGMTIVQRPGIAMYFNELCLNFVDAVLWLLK